MTFLNPLILIGLAAAAIPIFLHLFSLRKLEKIEFSTLTFLKELQKTRIRRLKLRQLLLLILRTLLIALIVTAFSRPTLKTSFYGGTNSQAKTTAVLILDNSYSMTSIDGDGQLLKQAKDEALGVLRLMKEGDEVYVIRPSEIRSSQTPVPSAGARDFAAVRSDIQSTEPSYYHGTIEDALRFAARLLSSSRNLNKEVFVFSDFKVGGLSSKSPQTIKEAFFPPDTRFFFLPVGNNHRENLGVESVKIENSLFGVGKPLTITARIRNWGSQDQKNDVVSVFLNGTRVAQKAVDILAQEAADAEFTVTPTTTGYIDGTIELPDDDLEFDNRASFAVYIPQQLRVLLVGSANDTHYLRLALSAQPAEGESTIKLSEISAQKLSTNEIQGTDVIIVANVRDLSSVQRTQVRAFVESGGGLIFFPGNQIDSTSYFSTWVQTLQLPPVSSVVSAHDQSSSVDFDKVDYHHPVFQGMFAEDQFAARPPAGGQRAQIESPAIQTHVRYLTNIQSTPIITLSDDSPFMVEQKSGKGVVVLFSVSATTDWSNFPLKGLFVPLIHSSAAYVAQQHSLPPVFTVGDEASVSLKNTRASTVTVENPEKVDVTSDVGSSGGETLVRFKATSLPGIYSVKSGNTLLKQFVVTFDPNESNTVRASTTQIQAMTRHLGIPDKSVETIDRKGDVQRTVVQSRVGLELWKYFVIAALLIGLLESYVARTAKNDLSVSGASSTNPPTAIP